MGSCGFHVSMLAELNKSKRQTAKNIDCCFFLDIVALDKYRSKIGIYFLYDVLVISNFSAAPGSKYEQITNTRVSKLVEA